MLVKLTADQIAKYWDDLRPMIEAALPPTVSQDVENRMNYILARLLADNMHCWVVQRGGQIWGVGTAIIQEDTASGGRDLLIYSLYALPGATGDDWKEAYETGMKWAATQGCTRAAGYTTNPDMLSVLSQFGAEMWTYAMVPFVPLMDKEED